jgi:DNA polymerase I-like protein with 3'-5' exonuclease and polymerase domains
MLTVKNPSQVDWANMPLGDLCEGNATDTYFTLKIYDFLLEQMKDTPVMKLVDRVLMRTISRFAEVEYLGLDVDTSKLSMISDSIDDANMGIEDRIYALDAVKPKDGLTGHDLLEILYTREGALELYPAGHTEKDAPSTAEPILTKMLEQINEELEKRY